MGGRLPPLGSSPGVQLLGRRGVRLSPVWWFYERPSALPQHLFVLCRLRRDASPGEWTWDLDPFLLQTLTGGGVLCQVWCEPPGEQ